MSPSRLKWPPLLLALVLVLESKGTRTATEDRHFFWGQGGAPTHYTGPNITAIWRVFELKVS